MTVFIAPDPRDTDTVVDELCWQFNLCITGPQTVRLMLLAFWSAGYTTADVEAAIRADCWAIREAVEAGAVEARSAYVTADRKEPPLRLVQPGKAPPSPRNRPPVRQKGPAAGGVSGLPAPETPHFSHQKAQVLRYSSP